MTTHTLYALNGNEPPTLHATGDLVTLLQDLHKQFPRVGVVADTGIVLDDTPKNNGKPRFILVPPASDKEIREAQGVTLVSELLKDAEEALSNIDSKVAEDSPAVTRIKFPLT